MKRLSSPFKRILFCAVLSTKQTSSACQGTIKKKKRRPEGRGLSELGIVTRPAPQHTPRRSPTPSPALCLAFLFWGTRKAGLLACPVSCTCRYQGLSDSSRVALEAMHPRLSLATSAGFWACPPLAHAIVAGLEKQNCPTKEGWGRRHTFPPCANRNWYQMPAYHLCQPPRALLPKEHVCT